MKAIAVPVIIAVFAALWVSSPVKADVWADCQRAIKDKDVEAANELAQDILRLNVTSDPKLRRAGLECLNYAMDEPYIYNLFEDALMTEANAAELAQERAETARIREELAKRRKQELQKIAEREALSANLRRIAEEEKEGQRQVVWRRVIDSCKRLYQKQPDETVTNRICLDVFLATGLPDE